MFRLRSPASLRENIRKQLAGTYSKNLAGGTGESSLETFIRENIPVSQALESGIAKAVPTSGGRDFDLENEELARIRQSPLFKARQPMTDVERYGSEELQAVTGELDDLFKKTIASQQEGTPGGSLPEDGIANYLTPESMAQAQRINVGSVPYLLDRATGKAYRADGAPITAAEQGTVDKFLATEQGTSQLSAVTEADAVAKEAKIASVQQDLIEAVQSNDVEGQIALRKELKEAKESTVELEPEPLVTEREDDPDYSGQVESGNIQKKFNSSSKLSS